MAGGTIRSAQPSVAHSDLWTVLAKVRSSCRFVDRTHAFRPGIPHALGLDEERVTLLHYDEGVGTKGSGFLAHEYKLPGQWGTHVDPPAHFVRGGRYLHEIPVSEMVLPLVVINCSQQAAKDPDYELCASDILNWEERHGRIPPGAFVALRTDWSKRWPDSAAMRNADKKGVSHFPGWGMAALRLLYEERGVIASGHETLDTDPGQFSSRGDYSREAYILKQGHWQIELLTNLDQVPESGAVAVATFPNVHEGSGFPARVIAIVPLQAIV